MAVLSLLRMRTAVETRALLLRRLSCDIVKHAVWLQVSAN